MGLFDKFKKDSVVRHHNKCGVCGTPISYERARRMAGLCAECSVARAKKKKEIRHTTVRQSAVTTEFRREGMEPPGVVGRANKLALARLKKLVPKLTLEAASAHFMAMQYGEKKYIEKKDGQFVITDEAVQILENLNVWSDGAGGLIIVQGSTEPPGAFECLGPLDRETFRSTVVIKLGLGKD